LADSVVLEERMRDNMKLVDAANETAATARAEYEVATQTILQLEISTKKANRTAQIMESRSNDAVEDRDKALQELMESKAMVGRLEAKVAELMEILNSGVGGGGGSMSD